MELLVINDKYDDKTLQIFLKHSIKHPIEGQIVELLRVENLKRVGKIGYFVKPFDNQWIIGDVHGGEFKKEVSFDSKRFVHLDGTQVTKEEIQEFIKQEKLEKVLVKPLKSKPYEENIHDF